MTKVKSKKGEEEVNSTFYSTYYLLVRGHEILSYFF